MTKIQELAELGQSIWLDYIRRSFITSGGLQSLIDLGLRGMTSNPTIFEKAIVKSDDYKEDLSHLAKAGKSTEEIYTGLVLKDIQDAADLLRQVYDRTEGADGYVSLEVNPKLARDSEATITEAKRLWDLVDRPNLMIKIPATLEGLYAITETIGAGVNVNVTLIFSLARYSEVMEAYLKGLELLVRRGGAVENIASVASFFVSRVDTKVDRLLEEIIRREGRNATLAASLRGQAAVASAKLAYTMFQEFFEGEEFASLKTKGAHVQRPLWASTSTKNPDYSDIKYVQELIAHHTVNTLPQGTLDAFLDHGEVRLTLQEDLDQARSSLEALEEMGISMKQVTQELEDEGVDAFAKSFESLISSIVERSRHLGGGVDRREAR